MNHSPLIKNPEAIESLGYTLTLRGSQHSQYKNGEDNFSVPPDDFNFEVKEPSSYEMNEVKMTIPKIVPKINEFIFPILLIRQYLYIVADLHHCSRSCVQTDIFTIDFQMLD